MMLLFCFEVGSILKVHERPNLVWNDILSKLGDKAKVLFRQSKALRFFALLKEPSAPIVTTIPNCNRRSKIPRHDQYSIRKIGDH